ncbi:MAG: MFS transporter [Proteobacteria bacterium]|nr:MFS transporter [Pseudomonadota bacterium]
MDPDPSGAEPIPDADARPRLEPRERRALWALSAIYAARMLGLFLLLPVLSLHTQRLAGSTPLLAGLAFGAYALTQTVLQMPFGAWSDRFGRRPVILAGLVLYAAGSIVGALATDIGMLIVAGLVQGAGAISGPVTALLADLTRPAVRTRAMAIIGASIGGSFVVSLLAAPLLEPRIGVRGIFWILALLAALCMLLLVLVVPAAPARPASAPATLRSAFVPALVPYYLGILALNFVLRATFFGLPLALGGALAIPVGEQWKTYLLVFALSVPPTVPLILLTERSARPVDVMRFGIALLMIALGWLAFAYSSYALLCVALTGFFAAFNYLEARLPAGLSLAAPAEIRGTALGLFATAQYLGAAAGGIVAGPLYGSSMGLVGVFGMGSLVALAWLLAVRPARR